jgi:transcription antitermination factor NusG
MSTCTQPAFDAINASASHSDSLNWYVVSTRPRHEKTVVEQCQQRGVESFLPLYVAQRAWKTRKAKVELPLFPTYLFVRMTLFDRLKVLTIPSAVSLVSFGGVPATIPDRQIEALSNAVRSRNIEPYEYLSVGKRVRINDGPFEGLTGVIVRRQGSVKFVVSFHWMCRSVAVLLNAADLEKMDS